jgi:hypothetical protein
LPNLRMASSASTCVLNTYREESKVSMGNPLWSANVSTHQTFSERDGHVVMHIADPRRAPGGISRQVAPPSY